MKKRVNDSNSTMRNSAKSGRAASEVRVETKSTLGCDLSEDKRVFRKDSELKSIADSTVQATLSIGARAKRKSVSVKRTRKRASSKNVEPHRSSTSGINFEGDEGEFPQFSIEKIRAKIDEVVLSDREATRRGAYEKSKHESQSDGDEKVFAGTLPKWDPGWLIVQGARQHNLKSIDVPFPISAFSVVTGVSGSGKSSLVEDVLFATLSRMLNHSKIQSRNCDGILGAENLKNVVHVNQSPIGQTPNSNPATYTGLFDLIRTLYSQLPESRVRGYTPRQFSFNVPGGRCEKCEGAGIIKVEMQFLADVWIPCDSCGGKRYNDETLQIKYRDHSIADTLETTCGEALRLFDHSPTIRRILKTLCDVGLDYLPLGQPATMLSGGEAQRVKLAAELSRIDSGSTLYVLDEPTTGLHFEDVGKLLNVLQRLVDLGNTVVVVEHSLDVIKCADWIIEIGPEAGLEGGRLVFAGTPEQLLEYTAKRNSSAQLRKKMLRSYTGEFLFPVFEKGVFYERPQLDVKQYWKAVKEETEGPDSRVVTSDAELALPPWETDGRRWHTELRASRNGARRHWDPAILTTIVDRLTEAPSALTVNWGNRSQVEAGVSGREGAWFMRATTDDEWLLKLRFRTAKNTFNRDVLTRKLSLKPLNEIDEIPLYGTQPRARVDTLGSWQEVEIRVFALDEIDRPEFWNFLNLAEERFIYQVKRSQENDQDLTPWKTNGREWHFSSHGFYGGTSSPMWSMNLLEKIFSIIQDADPTGSFDWNRKINVLFKAKESDFGWIQVFTKNADFICVQVNVEKNSIPQEETANLGYDQELDSTRPDADIFYLRYLAEDDLDEKRLREFLRKAKNVRATK